MKSIITFSILFIFSSFVGFTQANGYLTINKSNNITLPSGNYIVKDTLYDEGALTDIGIVSLYDGATNALISTLKGANSGDKVGNFGIAVLSNGNFIVLSEIFDNNMSQSKFQLYFTFIKNNFSQNLLLSSNNSILIFKESNYNNTIYADYQFHITELTNGNFIIASYEGIFRLDETSDNVIWVNVANSNIVNAVNTSTNFYYKTTFRDFYIFINRIIPLTNGNYLMWGADYVNGLVELFNGYNNQKLGNFKSYRGPPSNIPGPPFPSNLFGDCIKEVSVIDDNLFHIKFVTCPISFFPIRLNAETAENPIIDVYANTSSSQSGAEPFLTVSQTGLNPIEDKQYTAKVWLNEPNAFVNGGKTYLSRHFEITPIDNSSTRTGFVKLYLTQAEFDSYNSLPSNQLKLPTGPNDATGKHNLQIVKYAGTSSTNYGLPDSYTGSPTIINPKDIDIIWNGTMWEVGFEVTGFSGFFVSTEFEMPLPVTLESFTVKNIGNENELNWQTSNEVNIQSFQIERSIDALKFEKIGVVIANNSEKNNYQFIDKSPINYSTIYYRLKMNDLDGSYTFSKIISIQNEKQSISVAPSPATDKLTVNFGDFERYLNSNCKLLNSLGQSIKEFKIIKPSMELDLYDLPTGIYYLVLNDGNKIKFLKN